jgi:hypothetical protein
MTVVPWYLAPICSPRSGLLAVKLTISTLLVIWYSELELQFIRFRVEMRLMLHYKSIRIHILRHKIPSAQKGTDGIL